MQCDCSFGWALQTVSPLGRKDWSWTRTKLSMSSKAGKAGNANKLDWTVPCNILVDRVVHSNNKCIWDMSNDDCCMWSFHSFHKSWSTAFLSKYRTFRMCKLRNNYFRIVGRHLGFLTSGCICQHFRLIQTDLMIAKLLWFDIMYCLNRPAADW